VFEIQSLNHFYGKNFPKKEPVGGVVAVNPAGKWKVVGSSPACAPLIPEANVFESFTSNGATEDLSSQCSLICGK
jgi:hypothetical protein